MVTINPSSEKASLMRKVFETTMPETILPTHTYSCQVSCCVLKKKKDANQKENGSRLESRSSIKKRVGYHRI